MALIRKYTVEDGWQTVVDAGGETFNGGTVTGDVAFEGPGLDNAMLRVGPYEAAVLAVNSSGTAVTITGRADPVVVGSTPEGDQIRFSAHLSNPAFWNGTVIEVVAGTDPEILIEYDDGNLEPYIRKFTIRLSAAPPNVYEVENAFNIYIEDVLGYNQANPNHLHAGRDAADANDIALPMPERTVSGGSARVVYQALLVQGANSQQLLYAAEDRVSFGTNAATVISLPDSTIVAVPSDEGNLVFTDKWGDTVLEIKNPQLLGFFGATPIAQPEIPATPSAQDIADVLVALGLATQAA